MGYTKPHLKSCLEGFSIVSKDLKPDWLEAKEELERRVAERTEELEREIEKHRKSEAALQYSEQRFKDLVETMSDWVWEMDENLRFCYFSQGHIYKSGYDTASAYGKTRRDFIPEDQIDSHWRKHLEDLDAHRPFNDFVYRPVLPSGETRYWSITGKPYYDRSGNFMGYRGTGSDVTKRFEAEEALKESEKRLQHIFEVSPIAVGVSDPSNGRILFASTPCATMFGYTQDEWIGYTGKQVWADQRDREEFVRIFMLEGYVTPRETLMVRKDGSTFWSMTSWNSIQYGNNNCILFWAYDISHQKSTEQASEKAKIQAELATQAKSRFLANMSHEIRTPLNAVIGLSYLLQQTLLSDQQNDYVRKINTSSQHLLELLNNVLDFSKVEAGKLKLEQSPFVLDDVLNHVSYLMRIQARDNPIDLNITHSWDIPRYLIGDSLRLGQVLINLTENAIKFTDNGQVSVAVKSLNQSDKEVCLEFEVLDTGIGMTSEQQEQIFQSFSQADSATTRRYGGTGLGLAISKQLVGLMGGDIYLESSAETGTRFYFSAKFEPVKQPLGDPLLVGLENTKVLLLEPINNQDKSGFYKTIKSFGMDVTAIYQDDNATAMTGHTVSKMLDVSHYDLLISNESNSEIQLKEPLEQISCPHIQLLSPWQTDQFLSSDETDGLHHLLVKPVTPRTLLETINKALKLGTAKACAAIVPFSEDLTESLSAIAGARVLVVEDNLINQQVAKELLQGKGFDVYIASNGDEALAAVQHHYFDLVLMDIQMPLTDGYQTTKAIRELALNHQPPIIAMTAHALSGDRDKSLAVGMDEHLTKPIKPQQLFELLIRFISSKKLPNAGSIATVEDDYHGGLYPIDIAGFDLDAGLELLNGNRKLQVTLLQGFYRDNRNVLEMVEQCIESEQLIRAADRIHTLAGSAANLGAIELAEAAKGLQATLTDNAERGPKLECFGYQLHRVLESLQKLEPLQVFIEQYEGHGDCDLEMVTNIVEQLFPLLQQGNSKSNLLVPELRKALPVCHGKSINQIENQIDECEFEWAAENLKSLLLDIKRQQSGLEDDVS
ncbi:MAG: PAS domain S-box protein [Motiliproteus sp.]